MKLFKCFVTFKKGKFNFVIHAESKEDARDKLRKEGYSILTIQEINSIEESEKVKFYFVAENKEWKVIKWTVLSRDIFKVYLKFVEWLEYKLYELYSQEDESLSYLERKEILKKLEEQYLVYKKLTSRWKKTPKNQDKQENSNDSKKNYDNFFMEKKLSQTHKNIEEILDFTKDFLDDKIVKKLSSQEKESIQENYNNIVKVKKSTNIIKLNQIWEKILLKLWKIIIKNIDDIEENNLEENQEKYLEDLKQNLKKVNKLLKKVNSKENLKEKSRDIVYQLNSFLDLVKNKYKKNTNKKEKVEIDTFSNSYTKTLLLIEKYKKLQKQNKKELWKHLFIFFIPEVILLKFSNNSKIKKINEIKENILLRWEVIDQNIKILKLKIEKNNLFILKIKKIYDFLIKYILFFLDFITKTAFFIIFSFSFIFVIFNLINYFNLEKINLNYKWLFAFIVFSIFLLLLRKTQKNLKKWVKWVIISIINFVIFIFMVIFGVINF